MAYRWKVWLIVLLSILVVSAFFQTRIIGIAGEIEKASDGARNSTKVLDRHSKVQDDRKYLTDVQRAQNASSRSGFQHLLKDLTDKTKYPDEPIFELKVLFKK